MNCHLFGSHRYQVDSKNYGVCPCGAEKDYQKLLDELPSQQIELGGWQKGVAKKKFQTDFYCQSDIKLDYVDKLSEID